ncbi:hypothetical protein B9Z19DRAFT_1069094 [Tuber borchii]|uniref:Uncharacterized protein n=1 Tax=Tuber borchii TaxID=42251 RepID=A0A2T6ZD03_TUBBO|nr:hypothetical protein B9Z19DRAFT_1069094 [Tuber borchii]
MPPSGLTSPCSIRLWLDQASIVRLDDPLPSRLDKIQWQTYEHVYYMEMTEHTMDNLFSCINRVLSCGYGYRLLVGTTRQGMCILLDDPKEPLPLAEIITLRNSRHVHIQWSVNSLSELMDLLFYSHRVHDQDRTPSPGAIYFDPRDNRGPSPNALADDNGLDGDGNQLGPSAVATKKVIQHRASLGFQFHTISWHSCLKVWSRNRKRD